MFGGWENFFFLVGSAAGALIGLIFVVITLTAGQDRLRVSRGTPVYVTPIVFHFAVVLVVSAISEIPGIPSFAAGGIFAACALAGLAYAVVTTIRLCSSGWEDPKPEWSDKLFYGFLPTIIYIALASAAAALWVDARKAVFAVGIIMLALLMLGIRNAWDLATALAQRMHERHR